MHILVAETNTSFLDEIKHALEQAGYSVLAATNGMQAWTQLTDNIAPDLLVTCCHLGAGMPPGTALGLYARSSQPRIPVIYITCREMADHADAEHGAVLIKPFAVAELLETAHRLLQAS